MDSRAEFLLITLWDTFEAVQAFAGPEAHRAVFYPDDDRFLVARDEHVDHFEVNHLSGFATPAARPAI
jgi:heme-degrading monooxygenase HmoA